MRLKSICARDPNQNACRLSLAMPSINTLRTRQLYSITRRTSSRRFVSHINRSFLNQQARLSVRAFLTHLSLERQTARPPTFSSVHKHPPARLLHQTHTLNRQLRRRPGGKAGLSLGSQVNRLDQCLPKVVCSNLTVNMYYIQFLAVQAPFFFANSWSLGKGLRCFLVSLCSCLLYHFGLSSSAIRSVLFDSSLFQNTLRAGGGRHVVIA